MEEVDGIIGFCVSLSIQTSLFKYFLCRYTSTCYHSNNNCANYYSISEGNITHVLFQTKGV